MRTAMIIVVAVILSFWSAATMFVDLFFARPYRDVAEQLETRRGKVPDTTYFQGVEQGLGGDWVLSLCSRDIVRSTVTIKLASLEATYNEKLPASIDTALDNTRTTLERALRCFPNDGNIWLRLAIVNFAAKATPAIVEEQLAASLLNAPSEAWIAMPRLAFAAQIREATTAGIEQVTQTDARNLVNYARPYELAEFYLDANDATRASLNTQMTKASEERRAALNYAITAVTQSRAPRK